MKKFFRKLNALASSPVHSEHAEITTRDLRQHPSNKESDPQCLMHSNHNSGKPMIATLTSLSVGLSLAITSCSSTQVRAGDRYHYNFQYGKTALVQNGQAWAPNHAPSAVHRAIAAGNALQGRPYRYGGGHASFEDSGYDCSGTVSYVLHKAGLLDRTMTSRNFLEYGEPGPGRWITIYAREGHVFLTIAGLRIDTGGTLQDTGPRWKPFGRKTSKFVVRHPPGF